MVGSEPHEVVLGEKIFVVYRGHPSGRLRAWVSILNQHTFNNCRTDSVNNCRTDSFNNCGTDSR